MPGLAYSDDAAPTKSSRSVGAPSEKSGLWEAEEQQGVEKTSGALSCSCYLVCAVLQLHQYGLARSYSELNEQLMDYVEMLWDADCELEVCGQTLSAISYFLMAKGKLSGAWQLFGVWKLQEPPCRAAPMSRQMCMALASHSFITLRDPEFAISLRLASTASCDQERS